MTQIAESTLQHYLVQRAKMALTLYSMRLKANQCSSAKLVQLDKSCITSAVVQQPIYRAAAHCITSLHLKK